MELEREHPLTEDPYRTKVGEIDGVTWVCKSPCLWGECCTSSETEKIFEKVSSTFEPWELNGGLQPSIPEGEDIASLTLSNSASKFLRTEPRHRPCLLEDERTPDLVSVSCPERLDPEKESNWISLDLSRNLLASVLIGLFVNVVTAAEETEP
jgi:hypothetical protein